MVVTLLPLDFPANADLRTVWHCINVWHVGTRDAYLPMLHKFLDWFPHCGAPWPPAGMFTEAQLYFYVDFLLSQHVGLFSM